LNVAGKPTKTAAVLKFCIACDLDVC